MQGYAGINTILMCKFPSAKAGLSTVGFTLKNSDGTIHTARSATDVVNLGNGAFSAVIMISTAWIGTVMWDTGEGSPLYAFEEINIVASPAVPGAGSILTKIIVSVSEILLDNVAIYASTDIYGNNVVAGTLYTNTFGEVTFFLDPGVYYIWKHCSGYNFTNPETITVTA